MESHKTVSILPGAILFNTPLFRSMFGFLIVGPIQGSRFSELIILITYLISALVRILCYSKANVFVHLISVYMVTNFSFKVLLRNQLHGSWQDLDTSRCRTWVKYCEWGTGERDTLLIKSTTHLHTTPSRPILCLG